MKNSILGKARWLREVALATSKNNGARVAREWLKYAAMFVMLFTIGSGNAWGEIASGTYVLCTSTSDLEAGAHYIIASGTSGTVYCISNESNSNNRKTASATVSSSKITVASNSPIMTFTLGGDDTNGWTFSTDNYGGEAGMLAATSSNSNRLGVVASPGNNGKWAITFSSNLAKPVAKGTYTRKYMKYNYNSGSPIFNCYSSSGSESVYIYKLAASCDNKVTISKGSETNGTFTISPSGSQASCDGVAVMVTPTPASSAYYCSAVSASTGETGIDNGNGTWTVNIAANTTGTSTINVTFSLKTSYTVTWYNEGVSIRTESVYSGDKVSALPSPAPTSSCSGEFIGWVRSDADVADKSVTDAYTIQPTAPTLFTDVAGSPTITGNTAFHAVYRMPKQD